jgi:hypothetical protein
LFLKHHSAAFGEKVVVFLGKIEMDDRKRMKKNADALSMKQLNDLWGIGTVPKKENKAKTSQPSA